MFPSSEAIFSSSLIWRIQSYFGIEKVKCVERSNNKKWKTIKLDTNQKIEDVPADDNIIYYKVSGCSYRNFFTKHLTILGELLLVLFFSDRYTVGRGTVLCIFLQLLVLEP